MKKDTNSFSAFSNPELNKKIIKVPLIFIYLLIIIFPPLGTYLLIVKTIDRKKGLYKTGKTLITVGIFIFIIMAIYFYNRIKEIIVLYDTGMSLDMMDMGIEYWNVYAIIVFISFLIGGYKLMQKAKLFQKYTTLINIEEKTSIKNIAKKVEKNINDTTKDIIDLIDKEYLSYMEIDKSSKTLIEKDNKNKSMCEKCGSLSLPSNKEYYECDLCGNIISKKENN